MTTETFRISPQQYMRELAMAWISRNWVIPAMLLLAVVVWIFYDMRAIYVAFMLLFLIFPMILTFVWFNYAFSPRSLRAVATKRLILDGNELHIEYDAEDKDRMKFESEIIRIEDIDSVELKRKYISLIHGKKLDQRILVDRSAISSMMLDRLIRMGKCQSDALDSF